MKLESLKVRLYSSASKGMKEKAFMSGVVLDKKKIFRLEMFKKTKVSFGIFSSFGRLRLGMRILNKL